MYVVNTRSVEEAITIFTKVYIYFHVVVDNKLNFPICPQKYSFPIYLLSLELCTPRLFFLKSEFWKPAQGLQPVTCCRRVESSDMTNMEEEQELNCMPTCPEIFEMRKIASAPF